MKAKNIIIQVLFLIAGITIGYFSAQSGQCINQGSTFTEPSVPIDTNEAHKLFRAYYDSNTGIHRDSVILKGFTINKEKLDVFNKILKSDPVNIKGIRIYMGGNKKGTTKIIVGIDDRGQDLIKYILKTNTGISDPCPPICDPKSPIINPN